MSKMTVSAAKTLARTMIERMASLGVRLDFSQALEAVAACHQYPDWNRFRSALKQSRIESGQVYNSPATPHKLIVAFPGLGGGVTLQHDFQYQANQAGMFPILIDFGGIATEGYFAEVVIPESCVAVINAQYAPDKNPAVTLSSRIPSDCQGLIINLSRIKSTASSEFGEVDAWRFAWHSLATQLPDLVGKSRLSLDGTLYIQDFHRVDQEEGIEFDVILPALMREIRAINPARSLVVTTQSDASRKSLYRSPDDWKLITMIGDNQKLFYRCPYEKISVRQGGSTSSQEHYACLFKDPLRRLEDAALLIGSLSMPIIKNAALSGDPYGDFIVTGMKRSLAWLSQNRIGRK